MDQPRPSTDRDRPPARVVAALGPDLLAAVPLKTLSDDVRDEPIDPPEERVPEPERKGRLRAAIEGLRARLGADD